MIQADRRLLLLSDLHLSADTPATLQAVCSLLEREAQPGTAFALLGDIFEYWVGDDHRTPVADTLASACQAAITRGCPVYFMHGNRDFLVGQHWLSSAGIQALPDPWHGILFGTPTLLSHGDLLCTDDLAYQRFRQMSRNPDWQAAFLDKPLSDRVAYAQHLRAESMKNKAMADAQIMDVNPSAVEAALAGQWPDGLCTPPATRLIHGHTHRPAVHAVTRIDGVPAERIVLPDWDCEGAETPRGYALEIREKGVTYRQPV